VAPHDEVEERRQHRLVDVVLRTVRHTAAQ
jgi:hypothetical protein